MPCASKKPGVFGLSGEHVYGLAPHRRLPVLRSQRFSSETKETLRSNPSDTRLLWSFSFVGCTLVLGGCASQSRLRAFVREGRVRRAVQGCLTTTSRGAVRERAESASADLSVMYTSLVLWGKSHETFL